MENNKDEKDKNKRQKTKIIIIAIIILLFLVLIKLYFEFRAERKFLESVKSEQTEKKNLRSVIDSLCGQHPDACEEFEKYANVGALQVYSDPAYERNQLAFLIDSLCKIDKANCEKYKQFTDISSLLEFRMGLDNANSNFTNKNEQKDFGEDDFFDISKVEKPRRPIKNEFLDTAPFDDFQSDFGGRKEAACNKDTVAPWVYPEPTGGVYFEPIKVSFIVSEQCSVFYKRSKDGEYKHYGGESILISQNSELYYYAVDSCANVSEEQKKVYEFRQKQAHGVCPDGMAFVESPHGNFCIDQYEWKNRRGARPLNNISWQEARDSCLSVGKRLCTAAEWTAACKGPYNWKYPYGEKYIRRACATQDSTYKKSGEAGECRGWYAIYDMSGNLAEWTSTRAVENNRFFVVKGGFWESGNTADCDMSRYSYYPQNQHNQVGFRCCKDNGKQ